MVQAGLGDDSGSKLIEQRGIDFTPSQDFIQILKAAGASEAFLNALRAAKSPQPASAKKPINQVQVFALLVGQVPSHRVSMLVQERGIDFEPTDDYLQEVRLAGGEDELISALKIAKVTKPVTVDPAAQARQAEVRQHAARGAEFANKGQYAEAEREYREALQLDSQNDDLYVNMAYVLNGQKKWDDAASAARAALRLNPNNDLAHVNLGVVLGGKGDLDGMITEERAALRLNPNNDAAHADLGNALELKGDRQGAVEEYRAAYTLDPRNKTYREDYERLLRPSSQLGEAAPTNISGEWTSLTSGIRRSVRLEQGHAYVERQFTEEQSKLGMVQLCDLTGAGGKYEGTCKYEWVVRSYDRWHGQWKTRSCQSQRQMEFTNLSPSRIEGRAEEKGAGEEWSDKDKSNCGERFQTKWQDFVWIRPN
jgi:tetratricopeptide (TPR) repeat protein